jgi:hypothetical protein
MEMQPEGRVFKGGWLPNTGTLLWEKSMVSVAGANGTFLLVLAMAWWGLRARHDEREVMRWQIVIADVTWALKQEADWVESQSQVHNRSCVTFVLP